MPAATWLREARERALLSTSELARELGVSRPLVSLWESGQRPVRDPQGVAAVLARAGRPLEQLLAGVHGAGSAGLTEAEALAISPRLRREHLEALATERPDEVTWSKAVRFDPRDRPYLPRVLIAIDQLGDDQAADTAVDLSAAQVYGLRLVHGWTREQVASRLGVTPVTVAQWERGERPVPPARVDEVRALLLAETYGSTLRNARKRLGIGQAELARRLGVNPTTLHEWETGKKSPTKAGRGRNAGPGKLLHFAEVFAAAATEPPPPNPVDEAWTVLRGLLDHAGAAGMGAVELERAAQHGRRGRAGDKQARDAALRRARRLGEVAYIDVFVPTRHGGKRAVKRYVRPQYLPQAPEPSMSAEELIQRLRAVHWPNKRLADELGVSPATVTMWRRGRGVSGLWADRIRELLPEQAADDVAAARRLLLAAITDRSGGRTEVYRAAGYGKDNPVAGAALEQLLAEDRVHWLELTSEDHRGGRNRRVLRPGPAASLTGDQARQLRRELGLSQVALGARVGVSGPMISVWESRGDRLIPSNRSAQLLALCAARRAALGAPRHPARKG